MLRGLVLIIRVILLKTVNTVKQTDLYLARGVFKKNENNKNNLYKV